MPEDFSALTLTEYVRPGFMSWQVGCVANSLDKKKKKTEKLKVEQRLSFMDLSKCGKFRCVCECWPFSESDPVNAEIPLALPCQVISRLSALGVCCDLGSYPARICHLRTHIRAARMSCGRRNLSAAKGNNVRHIPLPGNVLHLMKCLCAK